MADPINCDAAALMEAAKAYKCIPQGMEQEVIIYLLCKLIQVLEESQQA